MKSEDLKDSLVYLSFADEEKRSLEEYLMPGPGLAGFHENCLLPSHAS